MQLAKLINAAGQPAVARVEGDSLVVLDLASGGLSTLADILAADSPAKTASSLKPTGEKIAIAAAKLLAPIDQQEVWAAGVTYKRSQTARMEESETAASCYDRVYVSPRPELFYKSFAQSLLGPRRTGSHSPGCHLECARTGIDARVVAQAQIGRIHDRQRHELARYRRAITRCTCPKPKFTTSAADWDHGSRWPKTCLPKPTSPSR